MASTYRQVGFGSTGSAVSKLQTILNQHGYGLAVDGIFGEKTRAAVRDYQKRYNLKLDGIAGPETWGSLLGQNGSSSNGSYTGGIAGYNLGTLRACINSASVNTANVDPTLSLDDLSIDPASSLTDLVSVGAVESRNATSDTGGIAGYSTGIVQSCTNSGAVGSDQIASPWQDEALAEYSTLLYYESVYGADSFDSLKTWCAPPWTIRRCAAWALRRSSPALKAQRFTTRWSTARARPCCTTCARTWSTKPF